VLCSFCLNSEKELRALAACRGIGPRVLGLELAFLYKELLQLGKRLVAGFFYGDNFALALRKDVAGSNHITDSLDFGHSRVQFGRVECF